MRRAWRVRVAATAVGMVAVAMLAAGCRASGVEGTGGSGSPTATTATATAVGRSGLVVASGHGWTSRGLDGPMPAAGSCHTRTATDGEPLPDPACTPGAVDAAVTDTNTASTICRKGGYTSSVRPPESLTEPAKKQLMAAYGIPASKISAYELDHFVALNDGGASDLRNLWPEPNTTKLYRSSSYVHNDKDAIEDYTYQAICDHKTTVTAVQKAMASNWTTAVAALGLPAIPANYRG
jgi:hypothetical protein